MAPGLQISWPPAIRRSRLRAGLGLRLGRACRLGRASRLIGAARRALGHERLGVERGLRELAERGRGRDGQLGQALAIERDAGGLQAGHELAVVEAVLARGGVDALDPERAEIALLAAAADEGVLQRGIDRLFRGAIELALGLVKPFGPAQQLLALGAPDVSTFNSRHYLLRRRCVSSVF